MAGIGFRRGRIAVWQGMLLALMFVAFGLQSYVTQTHIHLPGSLKSDPFDANPAQLSGALPQPDRHDKYPPNGDPANCPLCQEILYAGHYVAPAAVALFVPTVAVTVVAIADRALTGIAGVSYHWQGRAPPAA